MFVINLYCGYVERTFRKMLKLCGHSNTVQHKVRFHSLHQGGETDIGVCFVPHGHQDWAG